MTLSLLGAIVLVWRCRRDPRPRLIASAFLALTALAVTVLVVVI